MGSGVHLWLQDNNINFGQEVAPKEGRDTDEYGTHICGHGEGVSADEVESEEAHPGDHVHHEAEGDTLGLVVVGWQVFAHVAERETEDAQQSNISKLNGWTSWQGVTALQHNAVHVEVKILGRLGLVECHTEHRYEQNGEGHKENGNLWSIFFGPSVIDGRQFGCKFKNADDLEGPHSDAGQAHSEAKDE